MPFSDILRQYNNPRLLKQGGQKAAYYIQHPLHGETVLKVGISNSPRELERIKREVATLREIVSDYYPKNYDFQVMSNDRFVILEEYIKSRPLSQCLNEYSNPKDAVSLIRQLVLGLNVLWEKNIVHRDVKPDNILITDSGELKIIDLGIARLLDLDSLTTLRGAPLTLAYAAPEQILPNPNVIIDHRTDQYNLGIILAQLLLKGLHPFDTRAVGNGYSIHENIITNTWYSSFLTGPVLSDIKPLIFKLLGPYQHQRFRTPESLLRELDQLLGRLS